MIGYGCIKLSKPEYVKMMLLGRLNDHILATILDEIYGDFRQEETRVTNEGRLYDFNITGASEWEDSIIVNITYCYRDPYDWSQHVPKTIHDKQPWHLPDLRKQYRKV